MGNPRRTNGALRDKVRARVLREEDDCWLCHQPVDKTLPPYLSGSPEVDEVIPVSKGGDPYDRQNCRLSCPTVSAISAGVTVIDARQPQRK